MKKYIIIILISLLILTSFSAVLAQSNQEELDINISTLNGIAYRKTEQGLFKFFRIKVWTRLLDNVDIKKGETLKTAHNSLLSLDLGNNNKIEIKEDTVVSISEDIKQNGQILSVKKGVLWVNSDINPDQEFNLEINTPQGILNTTHAILEIEVIKNRTLITVEKGEVMVTEKNTLEQKELTAGQLVIIEDNTIKKYEQLMG